MTPFAHAPGGLRPASLRSRDLAFHPGLQLHAIQPPRTNRRLSLLISLLCYESLAAGMLLTLQHKEALVERIRTAQTVILDPVMARLDPEPPKPVLPVAPAPGPAVPALSHTAPAIPLPDVPPETTPSGNPRDQSASLLNPRGTPGVVGAGTSDTAAPSPVYGQGQPLEITVSQVHVLHSVQPVYPSIARITGRQGEVVLRMTIDATGAVSEVHVVSGPEIFRMEALRAARGWRFTPARVGGEAVPAAFNLTLQFVIR